MGSAAHDIGGPHHDQHPVFRGAAGSLRGSGELADGDAVAQGFLHMFHQRIVMAGHGQMALTAKFHDRGGVIIGAAVPHLFQLVHHGRELFIGPGLDIAVIGSVGRGITPLALPGRMVHQGDQLQAGRVRQGEEQVPHAGIGHFTAQMQQVVGTQHTRLAAMVQGIHTAAQHGDAPLVVVFAHGQGIEHGGDTGRHDLGIMGEKGGFRLRPDNFGTGHQMLFQIVGVQFHKTGQQIVTFAVDAFQGGSGLDVAFVHIGNQAVTHQHMAMHHGGGRHHPGVTQNIFFHG